MPRILYIEDNRDNRMLVRRVLMASDYDFVILEAENALRGIEMARTDPPDLILMDLSMPEMDGLTATHQLRNYPELNKVPIVALTANAMQGDKERTLLAGCDGYISKPIDVDKIADDVFRYLKCRADVAPVVAAAPAPEAPMRVNSPETTVPPKISTGNLSENTGIDAPVSSAHGSSQPSPLTSVTDKKPYAE